jgi:hypothetical protein
LKKIADDNVNCTYSKFQTSFVVIIDKHIPIKERKPVRAPGQSSAPGALSTQPLPGIQM